MSKKLVTRGLYNFYGFFSISNSIHFVKTVINVIDNGYNPPFFNLTNLQ
jgi:hypothetical protein